MALNKVIEQIRQNKDTLSSHQTTLNNLYPIGSIFISAIGTYPGDLIGGTWVRHAGVFLLAAKDDEYPANSTGGLRFTRHVSYLPPINNHRAQGATTDYYNNLADRMSNFLNLEGGLIGFYRDNKINETGGSVDNAKGMATECSFLGYTVSNMPPYLAVYIWQRTG